MSKDENCKQESISNAGYAAGETSSRNENLTLCHNPNNNDEVNKSLTDSSSNANVDEPCSAPVEILSEFLSTFMSHDYKSALYYCKLILQYEPDNEVVRDFYPLLLEKIDSNANESDDFTDNDASSFSKSESSTEYFSSASGGTENTSASSLSSDEESV